MYLKSNTLFALSYISRHTPYNMDFKIRGRPRQQERQKRIYVENIKQQLCMCSALFLYISWLSLHDNDVKMPDFTFYGGRKQATTKFSFSFWTWIWLLGIQFRRVRLHLTKNVSWINCDEDWRNANSLFRQRFRSRRHPWILNVSKLLTPLFIMKYCTLSCAG